MGIIDVGKVTIRTERFEQLNDFLQAASKAAEEAEKALMDILPVGDVFNALVTYFCCVRFRARDWRSTRIVTTQFE